MINIKRDVFYGWGFEKLWKVLKLKAISEMDVNDFSL